MAVVYNAGEKKVRPGVYMRIVNIGEDAVQAAASAPVTPPPVTPPEPPALDFLFLADANGVLLKTTDGYYLAVRK